MINNGAHFGARNWCMIVLNVSAVKHKLDIRKFDTLVNKDRKKGKILFSLVVQKRLSEPFHGIM